MERVVVEVSDIPSKYITSNHPSKVVVKSKKDIIIED